MKNEFVNIFAKEEIIFKTLFHLGMLFFAFLGGIILNLMPCVFPVLGIKILGFVQQSGSDKRKIRLHGWLFASGIFVSLWLLVSVLFLIRDRGESAGWGFQFQHPWFVLILIGVMFIFSLNLFGLFEIGTSLTGAGSKLQNKKGLLGSFFSGILFLARPQFILCIPFYFIFIYINSKYYIKYIFLYLIIFSITISPWYIRNYIVFDKFIFPHQTGGGENLWRGHHENTTSDGGTNIYGEVDHSTMVNKIVLLKASNNYEIQRDKIYRNVALNYIINNPLNTLTNMIDKLIAFWIHDFDSE